MYHASGQLSRGGPGRNALKMNKQRPQLHSGNDEQNCLEPLGDSNSFGVPLNQAVVRPHFARSLTVFSAT